MIEKAFTETEKKEKKSKEMIDKEVNEDGYTENI